MLDTDEDREPIRVGQVDDVLLAAHRAYRDLADSVAGQTCRTEVEARRFAASVAAWFRDLPAAQRDALGVSLTVERLAGVADLPAVAISPTVVRQLFAHRDSR